MVIRVLFQVESQTVPFGAWQGERAVEMLEMAFVCRGAQWLKNRAKLKRCHMQRKWLWLPHIHTHTHIVHACIHRQTDRHTDTSRICCALAQHAVAIKSLATSGAINGSTICTGTKQSSSATPPHCVPPLPLPCLANNWLALSTGFADHTHTHTNTQMCRESLVEKLFVYIRLHCGSKFLVSRKISNKLLSRYFPATDYVQQN